MHDMFYRPTDLYLLKGLENVLILHNNCDFPSEETVQSNSSSPGVTSSKIKEN